MRRAGQSLTRARRATWSLSRGNFRCLPRGSVARFAGSVRTFAPFLASPVRPSSARPLDRDLKKWQPFHHHRLLWSQNGGLSAPSQQDSLKSFGKQEKPRPSAGASTCRTSVRIAEGEGFEPPVGLPTTVFKTAAFGRSASPPTSNILTRSGQFTETSPPTTTAQSLGASFPPVVLPPRCEHIQVVHARQPRQVTVICDQSSNSLIRNRNTQVQRCK